MKVITNMKEFKITTDNGIVIDHVHATDERRALLTYLMKHSYIKNVELKQGIFYGRWMLIDCNNRDNRLFAKEETSSSCAISDEMKQAILDRTT